MYEGYLHVRSIEMAWILDHRGLTACIPTKVGLSNGVV
jgi:hypothetical protein